jgi:hypothetical protein
VVLELELELPVLAPPPVAAVAPPDTFTTCQVPPNEFRPSPFAEPGVSPENV